ncbi:alpha-E domain-containing protein [bacterium]|nr:alpha-E domain-containing protein [bacterium]
MLSRAASSIHWMGRYLERAENVARFIAVNSHLILDLRLDRDSAQWEPLVQASGDDEDFAARYATQTEADVVRFLTFDPVNPNSILSCIKAARENARTLREIIPSEMWEAINELHHEIERHSRKRKIDNLQDVYIAVRNASNLLEGLTENVMSHGEGWHFLRMGRLLERADKTARILDVKYFHLLPRADYFQSPYDSVHWGAVLKSVSGFEMYRQRFHRANYKDVTTFLILDPEFPRSIRFCVNGASDALQRIVRMLGVDVAATAEMEKLRAGIDTAEIEPILQGGLHEFIDVLQFNLNIVGDSLFRSFFDLEDA